MSAISEALKIEERQKALLHQSREILTQIEKEEADEARTAELNSQFKGFVTEFNEAEERKQLYIGEADMAATVKENEERQARLSRPKIDKQGEEVDENKRAYHTKFYDFLRSRGGQQEELELRELSGKVAEHRTLTTGTAGTGGALVPEETSSMITEKMKYYGPMTNASVVGLMMTDTGVDMKFPIVNDTSQEGEWLAESATATEGDTSFDSVTIEAHEFSTKYMYVPIALLEDAVGNAESLLIDQMGIRFGRGLNKGFTTGAGTSGVPNGIITAIGTNVTRSANATKISFDDLLNLKKSIDAAYWAMPGCAWMFHQDILVEIQKIKDDDNNYIWSMGDMRVGEPSQILGYRYHVNNAMDNTLAINKKTVVFGDLTQYKARIVKGYTVEVLRELRALHRQVVILGFTRADGDLLNTDAVKLLQQKAS